MLWILIFIVSLFALVKGADWLLGSAERIGLAFGMSPFAIGIVIVGIGTSFPELISSFAAVMQGVNEFVVANAIGSNIANILLVIGISAIVAKELSVSKDLIDLDIPLLSISTVILILIAWDRSVNFIEALLLLASYGVYLWYSFSGSGAKESRDELHEVLPSRVERRKHDLRSYLFDALEVIKRPKKVSSRDWGTLVLGIIVLFFGAKYLIDSVIALSAIFNIGASAIAIAAVAVGTSLPELMVSIKAAYQKKSEVALGNIFGSNVFNLMGVVGIPALFGNLIVDDVTFFLGIPMLGAATFLFIISGISRKIHIWEGTLFLILYIFFIGKLFALF